MIQEITQCIPVVIIFVIICSRSWLLSFRILTNRENKYHTIGLLREGEQHDVNGLVLQSSEEPPEHFDSMKRRSIGEEQQENHEWSELSDSRKQDSSSGPSSESRISEALTNLSFTDRNAIEEEVHGVSCMALEETPELLEDSLREFHLELDNIDSKVAYDRAKEIWAETTSQSSSPFSSSFTSACYIATTGYKIRFLRCELFDARKAARRYVKFIDALMDLYGEYALRRPIRITDLSREEMAFLREGQYQMLPYRDRSGRRVYCVISNNTKDVPKRVLVSRNKPNKSYGNPTIHE